MKKLKLPYLSIGLAAAAAGFSIGGALFMIAPASPTDKAFVAKISQDGLYQYEASKLAAQQATSPSIKAMAATQAEEHNQVNQALSRLSSKNDVDDPATMNTETEARLQKLKGLPPEQFDAAYVAEMQQVQTEDDPVLIAEAQHGTGGFKNFASQSLGIEKNDLYALQTASVKTPAH
jgi:predicted outer membrane protein